MATDAKQPGTQVDSYSGLLFVVSIDGPGLTYLGTFSEISGLGAEVEVYTYEEGGRNDYTWKLPKQVKYPNLTLKYGMTDDRTLENWITQFLTDGKRSQLTISTMSAFNALPEVRWTFYDAWPVKWTGPTFSATQNQVALETLEIAHHGPVSRL
jgi:phage tail-like protein